MGGTKYRALRHLISTSPFSEFSYAGTIKGHGAIALAKACADTQKQCTIHISGDHSDPRISTLKTIGDTRVIVHPPMPIHDLYAHVHALQPMGDYLFKPGFDEPAFEEALMESLQTLDITLYSEIWTCAVTGALTRALERAFPAMRFHTVKVVKSLCELGHGTVYQAPEKYHQVARVKPPYPSCPYNDAKIWQFANKFAARDALIWNTAGELSVGEVAEYR